MNKTIVELAVVGIRNYCEGGEEGYPELFARLPIGTTVFLRKEPTNTQFPGSVSVLDDDSQKIGNISKTDRRYIDLEIPEGELLPVTISGHSAEDNCLYVKAENTKGYKEPYIRDIQLTEGETVFAMTDIDREIQKFTSMMKTKIKMLKEGIVHDTASLIKTANDYVPYCCASLDGETSFSRADILMDIKDLVNSYPELNDVYYKIFEPHKDIGRKYNDVKAKTYIDQYNRIKESAFLSTDGGRSQMDDYLAKLKFANGGILTKKLLNEEMLNLSALLANEMMRGYEKYTETPEAFATALYSLNYSMSGIYRLYTRQIKLDHLKVMQNSSDMIIEAGNKNDALPIELFHFIYPGLDDNDAQIVHRQVKDIVKRFPIKDICIFLKKLADQEKILLPQNPQNTFEELHRMGLPSEETEGYGYDNFCKNYRKIKE